MIRIALVDDHSLFRRGMKMLLSSQADFEVVVEAGSGEEFLQAQAESKVDLVFMDYSMPGINGAETTERALEVDPELKVISLSMFGDNAYYSKMVESGAKGFLLKDSEFDEVLLAVRTVCEGGTYFSPQLMESISFAMTSYPYSVGGDIAEEDRLSEREVEILVGICQGLSTQEIADKLYISKRTVDKHRANILEKSGSKNTASLVVYAIKHGLVEV
ncbi:MAG: response regulator transcription factor [Alistipes sp.]|jgi:DNA-binding NarL/FixJ family response regulator|nr:response regulator transcription factor [Alistipes sp.]MBQ1957316.1 response regulator transcription factor [Alistipes sp.]MBQ1979685.1 response regulator transcription factor [Alistipes sp.]MBQ2415006.1 response regulator transcription factor [Alistipes sp.]MBQ5622617.1 response regulator transcription factor [Alistipes sp.]